MATICDDCKYGPDGKLPVCRLCSVANSVGMQMLREETTRRLRDVAAAVGSEWEAKARSFEAIVDTCRYVPSSWLREAIYYRGLLSLCEVE